MTPFENEVKDRLVAEGFEVLRSGWPDFLAVKRLDTQPTVRFVEVKGKGDAMRPAQTKLHAALKAAGINVEVVWEEKPGPKIVSCQRYPCPICGRKWMYTQGKECGYCVDPEQTRRNKEYRDAREVACVAGDYREYQRVLRKEHAEDEPNTPCGCWNCTCTEAETAEQARDWREQQSKAA